MRDCGCNDWMTTQRRTSCAARATACPYRAAVLGRDRGPPRRDFLRNGAIAFLTVYGARALSWGRIWDVAAASAAAPRPTRSSSRSS